MHSGPRLRPVLPWKVTLFAEYSAGPNLTEHGVNSGIHRSHRPEPTFHRRALSTPPSSPSRQSAKAPHALDSVASPGRAETEPRAPGVAPSPPQSIRSIDPGK